MKHSISMTISTSVELHLLESVYGYFSFSLIWLKKKNFNKFNQAEIPIYMLPLIERQ